MRITKIMKIIEIHAIFTKIIKKKEIHTDHETNEKNRNTFERQGKSCKS